MTDEPEKIKIELSVSIGLCNATRKKIIKVNAEDWTEMDEATRDEFMQEELANIVEWDYREVGGNE